MGAGSNIKQILKTKKLKQKDLIIALNENQSNVARWLSEIRGIPEDIYPKIAEFLNVSIHEIMGSNLNKETDVKPVPIIGTASCGACDMNVLQDLSLKALIAADDWNIDLYAVIANGASMSNEIYDGDIAISDPNIQLQSGDMVFYKIDDEAAIKIFVDDKENNMFQFVPYNSNKYFKTRNIRLDDETLFDRLTMHKVVQVVSIKKNNRAARLKMIGR